jgi:hypothetical protein
MTKERDEDLMRAYRKQMDIAMKASGEIKQMDIIAKTVNSPASRYWISLERACAIIYGMRKGNRLGGTKSNTKRLYESLYESYLKAEEENPGTPVKHLIAEIIEQPAPCFAFTWKSASLLINKIRKEQWYKERRRLLRHLF